MQGNRAQSPLLFFRHENTPLLMVMPIKP